ncbi:MAG: hypothetical protein V4736_05400 [Bdellovibrionota bacterium]
MKTYLSLKIVLGFAVLSFSLPASADVCEARTTCADGREISCGAQGGSCTSDVVNGESVVCIGYDLPDFMGSSHQASETCN